MSLGKRWQTRMALLASLSALLLIAAIACSSAAPASAPTQAAAKPAAAPTTAPAPAAPAATTAPAAAPTTAPAPAAAKKSGFNVFMIPKAISIPVFTALHKGAAQAAEELGDKLQYNGPSSPDPRQQVEWVNNVIPQKPDAILFSAMDEKAAVPSLKNAMSKGIKVYTYDSDVTTDGRIAFASTPDDTTVATNQLELVGRQINYEGEVAILSGPATSPNQARWIKEMQRLTTESGSKYSKMKIVKVAYGDDIDSKAAQEMQGLLQAYPNLKGVMAPTVVGIVAGARVLQEQNKKGFALAGLALAKTVAPFLKDGTIKVSSLWNPLDLGYFSYYMTHRMLAGEATGKEGETIDVGRLGKTTFKKDATIYFPSMLELTKDNVDQFDW